MRFKVLKISKLPDSENPKLDSFEEEDTDQTYAKQDIKSTFEGED